ncbi:MAG: LCP family protein, partial [Synergistaceae bacterium]|nr:LCP family protein [Candidatus Equadaptatus faecalis]
YVRFRKDAQGDIGRVQRQQQFIKALLKKAYSPAVITRFPSIVSSTLEVFQTNMPIKLATALAGFAVSEFKREDIYMSTLYGEADLIDGLSFWIGDPAYGKRFINATLGDLQNGSKELGESGVTAGYTKGYSSASEEARQTSGGGKTAAVRDKEEILKTVQGITQPVAVLNGSGAKGISAALAKELQTLGVDVVYVGNAKHNDYMYTNISYPTGAASTISYPTGSGSSDAESAKKLGALLSVPDNLIRSNAQTTKVSVILGHDYKEVFKMLESIKETVK